MQITTIRSGPWEIYEGLICERHNYRETARYAYLLANYDCPTCAAIDERDRQDREDRAEMLARRGHPSICLCHACAPYEAEYERMDAEEAARRLFVEIKSPDYCDHLKTLWGPCSMSGCTHAACKSDQEPPF